MPDTDMLEVEELEKDTTEQPEQQVEIPEHPAGRSQSREELISEALEEGVVAGTNEQIVEELSSKEGELTVEDFRRIPGNEEYTDEELVAEWNKQVAIAQGGQAGGEFAQAEKAFEIPFPVYDDKGNKLTTDKVTLEDLVSGKVTIGYQAMDKEQRKTFSQVLRNASLGHLNESRYNSTIQERNQAVAKQNELNQRIAQYEAAQTAWNAALTALSMGNAAPMTEIAKRYAASLTQQGQPAPAGYVPVEQVQREQQEYQQAQQYWDTNVVPAANEIAAKYNANPAEVVEAVKWFLRREPAEFITDAKVQEVLKYDIPAALEDKGYNANGTQTQKTSELDELKNTVTALQKQIAEGRNARTQNVRERSKKAPPAGGGAVPSAGDSMPSFKSRSQMQAWLRGDQDWSKA